MAALLRRRAWMGAAALLAMAPALHAQTVTRAHQPDKIDPSWLKADSAKATVELAIHAGFGSGNGNMNFDGAYHGGLVLVVPVNWNVILHFKNDDQILPHSVLVIPALDPVPVNPPGPAFPHAASGHLSGSGPDAKEDIKFVADKAGSYYIFCAVEGHGAAGMWIRMEVRSDVSRPSLVGAGRRTS